MNAKPPDHAQRLPPDAVVFDRVRLDYVTSRGSVVRALNDIDLRIPYGGCTAIVGGSGSGKSSILRAIAGLSEPNGGAVLFPAFEDVRPRGTRLAMLFQGESHFPWLTVEQNLDVRLELTRDSHKIRKVKSAETCKKVGLPAHHLYRYPHELSGGERRRIELAMTLVVKPNLLLLDEPTTGLDYLVKLDIQDLLSGILHDDALTAVLVTHDVEEAVRLADRILVIGTGTVLACFDVHISHANAHSGARGVDADLVDQIVGTLRLGRAA